MGTRARSATAAGLLALAACVASVLGCAPRPAPDRPNLVLVVLDTTRRDHLSLYGYPRPTTPALEALALSSTVYEDAYSTSSWTPPSHASLFTGLYPHTHGVTQASWELPRERVTLAELLWEAGYQTIAIVGNPMVGRHLGFDQGFETYHETWREDGTAGGEHPAIRHFAEFLEDPGDRPFLVFFNLNEPHNPYTPPPRYQEEFVGGDPPELTQNHWREVVRGLRTLSEREISHLGDLYDAELRYVDDLVGRIVAQLEEHDLLDDSVLIVTSDHGENLGEHGMLDHVFNLYETTVRVPLLVRYPPAFAAGKRVAGPVQLVDVHATLAGLAGLDGAASQGVDLRNDDPDPDRPVLLSYDYPHQVLRTMGKGWETDPLLDVYKRRLFALREGGTKLIFGSDGHVELYDLLSDPAERIDLAAAEPSRVEQLTNRIQSLLVEPSAATRRDAPTVESEVDAATLEALRTLGYAE